MGRPLGSKNKPKMDTPETTAAPAIDSSPEIYTPRPRKNRKNRQTLETKLLTLASRLSDISRTLKELGEEVRNHQDILIQKVRETILDQ